MYFDGNPGMSPAVSIQNVVGDACPSPPGTTTVLAILAHALPCRTRASLAAVPLLALDSWFTQSALRYAPNRDACPRSVLSLAAGTATVAHWLRPASVPVTPGSLLLRPEGTRASITPRSLPPFEHRITAVNVLDTLRSSVVVRRLAHQLESRKVGSLDFRESLPIQTGGRASWPRRRLFAWSDR